MLLLSLCDKSYLVEILLIIKTFFKLICYIVPLIIIIVTIINLFKTIQSGKEEDMKDNLKLFAKRIIAGLLITIIPTLFSYVFSELIDGSGVELIACMQSATAEKVSSLKEAEEAEDKANSEAEAKEAEELEKEAYEEAHKNDSAKKENFDNAANERNQSTTSSNNTGSGTTTSSGDYYSPFGNQSYSVSAASSTGGCPNNGSVYHDSYISGGLGSPVYAVGDGTVVYEQHLCKYSNYTEIISYGNLAKLTLSDGSGMTVYYAHLSKFSPNFIPNQTLITNSCNTRGTCKSCPSKTISSLGSMQIKKGDIIGYMGNYGNSEGPHLHIEVHTSSSSTCIDDPFTLFGATH